MTNAIRSNIRTQAAFLAHETRRANAVSERQSKAADKAWATRRANAAKRSQAAMAAHETRRAFRPALGGSVLVAAV